MIVAIFKEALNFFEPIIQIAKSDDKLYEVEVLFIKIGLFKYLGETERQGQLNTISEIFKDISEVIEYISEIEGKDDLKLDDILQLENKIKRAFEIFQQLKEIDIPDIDPSNIPRGLLDYLWINYLYRHRPTAFYFSYILQLIKKKKGINEKEILTFHPEVLGTLIKSPETWFRDHYGWGGENFLAGELLEKLYVFLSHIGTTVSFGQSFFSSEGTGLTEEDQGPLPSLRFPLYNFRLNDKYSEIGLEISEYSDLTDQVFGLKLFPYTNLDSLTFTKKIGDEWMLNLASSINFNAPLGLVFFDKTIKIESFDPVTSPNPDDTRFSFELIKSRVSPPSQSRKKTKIFEVDGVGLKSQITIGRTPDVYIGLLLTGISFNINTGQSDNFIKNIIKEDSISSFFDLSIGWGLRDGLQFGANAGLEIDIPVHKKLAFINLKSVLFGVYLKGGEIDLKGLCSLDANLGPLFIQVDKIGLSCEVDFEDGGNLGILNIGNVDFVPPKELAVAVEASPISGGGFLEFDQDNHRYAGILALNLQAIELTAIALITTRLPNNKPGFSMLVNISVLFNPAIQLSFGFTLVGVGGLLGINRTMKVDVLRERLASGAINSIMFPTDPIENADRIISDLRAVFPPEEKHYIIAPFLRIGYGTPSIIEVDLGVLIEIPFKGRIILLGSVGVYLPVKDGPLIEIHIDVLGDLNFAAKYIQVEGRLRDSHIVNVPLTGGFAFVLDWGKNPAFLFSIGGYHPRYKRPERFPAIPRLAAVIRKGKLLVLTCEFYQAITSNTFQIGFRAGLTINYKGARLLGHLGFNALLQFDPLYLEVDISMSVDVRYKGKSLMGVDLHFTLIGPSPWIANGYARIKILLLKLKVKFRAEWGRKKLAQPATILSSSILSKTKEALEAPQNWTTKLPSNFETAEFLKPQDEVTSDGLVMHPSGYLEVQQSVVPLNQRIQKFGNSYVEGLPTVIISKDIYIGNRNLSESSGEFRALKAHFALAQFQEMSDAEKISRQDFEEMESGLSFGKGDLGGFSLGLMEQSVRDGSFENIIVRADLSKIGKEEAAELMDHDLDTLSQKQILKKRVGQSNRHINKFQTFVEVPSVGIQDQACCIVKKSNLQAINDAGLGRGNLFETYTEAKNYLETELSNEKESLKIMTLEAHQMA